MNTPTEERVVFQQEIAARRLCGARAHRRPTTNESPATDSRLRKRGRGHDRNGDNPAPTGATPADTLGDRTAEPDVKLTTRAPEPNENPAAK